MWKEKCEESSEHIHIVCVTCILCLFVCLSVVYVCMYACIHVGVPFFRWGLAAMNNYLSSFRLSWQAFSSFTSARFRVYAFLRIHESINESCLCIVNTSPFWQEVQFRLLSIKQSCSQIADYCAQRSDRR